MAWDFATKTDWFGNIRPRIDWAESVENLPELTSGYVYKRNIYSVERWRYGQDGSGIGSEIGTTTTSGLVIDNGGDEFTATNGTLVFICEGDLVDQDPPGSGIWRQSQVWTHVGDWVSGALSAAIPL